MTNTTRIIWKNLPSRDARKAVAVDLIRKANNEGARRVTLVKISKCGKFAKGELLSSAGRFPTQVELPTEADDVTEAEELRDSAAKHEADAADSFERCDTDGFVSQWASGLNGQLDRARAEIVEAGGTSTFVGLFVAETGERVRAKLVEQADRFRGYGTRLTWFVLDAEGKTVGYIPHSKGTARSKIGKLGLELRDEQAPAAACHKGSGTGLAGACSVYVKVFRTDDGYPADAVSFEVSR